MPLKGMFIITTDFCTQEELDQITDKYHNGKNLTQFVDRSDHYLSRYIRYISTYGSTYQLNITDYLKEYEKDVVFVDGMVGYYINPEGAYTDVRSDKPLVNTLPLVNGQMTSVSRKKDINTQVMHQQAINLAKELYLTSHKTVAGTKKVNYDHYPFLESYLMYKGYNWPDIIIFNGHLYQKFSELDFLESTSTITKEKMNELEDKWNLLAKGIWESIPDEWVITVRFVNV